MATLTYSFKSKKVTAGETVKAEDFKKVKTDALTIPWSKTKELVKLAVMNALLKRMDAIKGGMNEKAMTDLPNNYVGKHEVYISWKTSTGAETKSAKIDLTISPEPVFDIAKECPDFAAGSQSTQNGEYWGGLANQPHVHVIGGGVHLKLGNDRYNLVQDNKVYVEGIKKAYEALRSHGLKDRLIPYVRGALKKFNLIS